MAALSDINVTLDPASAIARAIADMYVATIQAWVVGRSTMSQENRNIWDALIPNMITRFNEAVDRIKLPG